MNARVSQFDVKGIRGNDPNVTVLKIAASSAVDASARAQAQGYYVLGVKAQSYTFKRGKRLARHGLSPANLSTELLALLRAGLTLPEAMSALQQRRRSLLASQTIDHICNALREGRSLSRALEDSGDSFSSLFIATIRSSEETGDMIEALSRYLDYDRRMHAVRNTLVSAAIYPAILLIAGALVIAFLLGYVIPRFSRIYTDLGEDHIPAASRALMHLGQLIDQNRPLVACGTIGGLLIIIYAAREPRVLAKLTRWIWSIPVLGARVHLYQLARFSHTLAMLLRGGIGFVPSLDMALGLLQLPSLKEGLVAAKRDISRGQPISASFTRHSLATEIGARMLAAGERTGNMADMMDHIARLYDEELREWVDRFTRLFEPLLMTVIGVTIGIVVLLMYMPIFGLASSIE